MEAPNFIVDVGWPFSSDKAMVACAVCGMGMFVPIDKIMPPNPPYVPVHECCLAQAQAGEKQ